MVREVSMRQRFHAHFLPDRQEIDVRWKEGLFVFDANTLLNLYRYSDRARDEFLEVLNQLRDRVHLPEQAAQEFFSNRLNEISAQEKSYEDAIKSVRVIRDNLQRERGHPFISAETLDEFNGVLRKVVCELNDNQKRLLSKLTNDDILPRIAEIFDGRVGEALEQAQLNQCFLDGATRYAEKIPPGYADDKKHSNPITVSEKRLVYGDLIIWKQTIELSKSEGKSIVFVTDDSKEDWWLEVKGRTIGPRPELVSEFYKETGLGLQMYRPEQFLQYAKDHLNSQISLDTIQEIAQNTRARVSENALLPDLNVFEENLPSYFSGKDFAERDEQLFVRSTINQTPRVTRNEMALFKIAERQLATLEKRKNNVDSHIASIDQFMGTIHTDSLDHDDFVSLRMERGKLEEQSVWLSEETDQARDRVARLKRRLKL
jgi:hypothetical protein